MKIRVYNKIRGLERLDDSLIEELDEIKDVVAIFIEIFSLGILKKIKM